MRRLGVSGTIFIVALLSFLLFVWWGNTGGALLVAFVLLPMSVWMAVRAFRFARRHSLWSLRNRLLVVYALLGILPGLLVVTLVGLSMWALMSELASYLAGAALDRRLEWVDEAITTLRAFPLNQRMSYAAEVFKPFRASTPGFTLIVRDAEKTVCFPKDAPLQPKLDPQWKNAHGLLVADEHFYAWAHFTEGGQDIVALAPLNNETIKNLVPHLGDIALVELPEKGESRNALAYAGSATVTQSSATRRGEFRWTFDSSGGSAGKRTSNLPPPMFRLDWPVFIPTTRLHYHLDAPNRTFSGVLWVHSRPSAVLSTFFSGSEVFREFLFDSVIAVGVVFLIVELFAIWIGVSLAKRITGAVNQLYEGTRRVIHGDFRHRIAVNDSDQLGDLSQSFNQMTENLERLLSVEKEKERLQTELEIAREVQNQLYPRVAPPAYGLRLTVRCDPARMVSGDYYDYQDVGYGKLVFAIGDVAGKGISAALLMATLQAALRAQITSYSPPVHDNECTATPEVAVSGLVSRLNKQIYAHTSPEKYATFFFGLFDEKSQTLTYTNAGHLSPLLFREKEVVALDSNGTVVGAFPFACYDESCLKLSKGDLLVCYTDGITEPENAYGEMFGEERLIELVRRHAHRDDGEILDLILEAVRSWTDSPELHDDMTLLLARHV